MCSVAVGSQICVCDSWRSHFCVCSVAVGSQIFCRSKKKKKNEKKNISNGIRETISETRETINEVKLCERHLQIILTLRNISKLSVLCLYILHCFLTLAIVSHGAINSGEHLMAELLVIPIFPSELVVMFIHM